MEHQIVSMTTLIFVDIIKCINRIYLSEDLEFIVDSIKLCTIFLKLIRFVDYKFME